MLFFVISPLNLNEEAISLIAFLVTLSTSISIVIFFIKRYYADEIKKKLSWVIDFDRIEENRIRWAHLEEMVEERFPNVNFTSAKLLLVFNVILFNWSARCCGTSLQGFVSACLVISCLINILLFYRIRLAIAAINIPPNELPVPSKFQRRLWESRLLITEWVLDMLFGRNRTHTLPPTNEQLEQRMLKNKNRYAVAATTGLFIGAIVGAVGYWDFSYTSTGQFSPIGEYLQTRRRGYYSSTRSVAEMAWELDRRGCNMESFCYPNTKKLDEKVIQEAYDYVQDARNSGKKLGVDLPLPKWYYEHTIDGIGEPDKSPFPKIESVPENKAAISDKEDSSIV